MTAQQNRNTFLGSSLGGNCPFFDSTGNICRAALLSFVPDPVHLAHYCDSDDHDDCALFLAKALRSSAAGGLDRDFAACCGK